MRASWFAASRRSSSRRIYLRTEHWHVDDNAAFFTAVLPGRDEPLGDPGGAEALGRIGVDTARVAEMPPNSAPHP